MVLATASKARGIYYGRWLCYGLGYMEKGQRFFTWAISDLWAPTDQLKGEGVLITNILVCKSSQEKGFPALVVNLYSNTMHSLDETVVYPNPLHL